MAMVSRSAALFFTIGARIEGAQLDVTFFHQSPLYAETSRRDFNDFAGTQLGAELGQTHLWIARNYRDAAF